jgi:hypothetical protein
VTIHSSHVERGAFVDIYGTYFAVIAAIPAVVHPDE